MSRHPPHELSTFAGLRGYADALAAVASGEAEFVSPNATRPIRGPIQTGKRAGMPQRFMRLRVDGKETGRITTDIRELAADAVDMGFAWPDVEGRLVLSDHADIVELPTVKCAAGPCGSAAACALTGRCQQTGSCNNH
jgi:hypothetical protein